MEKERNMKETAKTKTKDITIGRVTKGIKNG